MWKYGYHKGLNKFVFEPLQMLLEKYGIELEPYKKWEFLRKWYEEFPYNFKTLQGCRMFFIGKRGRNFRKSKNNNKKYQRRIIK